MGQKLSHVKQFRTYETSLSPNFMIPRCIIIIISTFINQLMHSIDSRRR